MPYRSLTGAKIEVTCKSKCWRRKKLTEQGWSPKRSRPLTQRSKLPIWDTKHLPVNTTSAPHHPYCYFQCHPRMCQRQHIRTALPCSCCSRWALGQAVNLDKGMMPPTVRSCSCRWPRLVVRRSSNTNFQMHCTPLSFRPCHWCTRMECPCARACSIERHCD